MTAGTGLRLPALSGWPLAHVTLRWEQPAEVKATLERRARGGGAPLGCGAERATRDRAGGLEELATPRLRGTHRQVCRRVLIADIFGFARPGLPLRTERCDQPGRNAGDRAPA